MKRFSVAFLVVCLSACGSGSDNDVAARLDESRADTLQVTDGASRIVSLSPAITEILFAIGAGDKVVGRTRWGDYPPEVTEIESVGDGMFPNVEAVASLQPDLVVFYQSTANAVAREQLRELNIPTASVRMDRLADVPAVARILGRLTGDSLKADSIAGAFETELARGVSARAGVQPHCSVAIVVWDNPPMVIGGGSFLTEIVELAGSWNVFGDIDAPSPQVSIEAIVERNPNRIMTLGIEGIPEYAERPEWQVVDAVRNLRFTAAIGSEFSRPTLRALETARRLEGLLGDCE